MTDERTYQQAKAKLREIWREDKISVILGFLWMLPSLILWFTIGLVDGVRVGIAARRGRR